ncbi:5'/3'-nucleotidase SurE [Sphingomonas montanisoli]|uniref:5'-nucleotidase SurE n=1 Tax=Sphingomonas montanisoli TaxID=2606412 RepID=A0A5D9CD65_9SPHN|nr:5'/3'-nucleotidase SurE [Sphingomonas montanisoli]TZG29193.1 5'/3'-nucleotidase SurE [Sphingomonas montanisoli]
MRILLTNDDGVNAPGLAVLEAIARTLSDDITIVAPAEEQSGAGRSLTLTRPLRMRQLDERRYAVAGTPTDAVMMALTEVMKDGAPDLILSGVNRGSNLAEDVSYSGTVAAAMEGALAGIRSVALSQIYTKKGNDGPGTDVSFAAAEAWGERALRPLLDAPWAPRTLVNINFPAIDPESVQGIKVVSQGLRDYGGATMERRMDPRGFPYYWLRLASRLGSTAVDTDLEAAADGWVTVTPLHCVLTHEPSMASLADAYR